MRRIIKADGIAEMNFLKELRTRSGETDKAVTQTVTEIINDVRENGDSAVDKYSKKFDGFIPEKRILDREDIRKAAEQCEGEYLEMLRRAAANIERFHRRQVQQSWLTTEEDGVILGQRIRGLHRVGVYVPGGTAAYPSSVLMCVIPAKIAGVKEIVMVTPPSKEEANKTILAAAYIAGVDKIYLMGGAQAVAALAYGTETVPKADKIVGPGNIYVATAKRLIYGAADIDMIAGPSDILIVADDSANYKYLAADLLSQAEHDVLASSILITVSMETAELVQKETERQLNNLPRKEIAKKSIENNSAIIVCENMDKAVELANEFAPEHLEVSARDPMTYIGKIDNAGSVFLGNYSPEPLGDYYVGPNHVLPTLGTARFFSPLSVDSFVKKSSFMYYTKSAFERSADDVIMFAESEGLKAHANSVRVRREDV